MSWTGAVLIGVVQGVTEFLPVSSSAHLVFAQRLLGIRAPGMALEAVLHAGTLAAALVYFRRQWADLLLRLPFDERIRGIGLLAAGTVPAAAAGLLLRDRIAARFHDPRLVGACLVAGGGFMIAAGMRRRGAGEVRLRGALAIGAAQAAALLPGVSRSGMTVGAALFGGVRRERAVEFSFMLAVPAILGALVVEGRHIGAAAGEAGAGALAAAAAAAFLSGLPAIALLVRFVREGRLAWFGFYCCAAGAAWLTWIACRGTAY
ncbi:MAG: undecaprenyl-diphosphate phosphatase [bacterium]|nr:undecaprenyl-diphosphate phosphatase [bacterium]